ncbi:uncharacterized protein LOC126558483 [Anopheles maculipalpis]|uniref:uncharacterized protein LOC126558483 n=1 Tax=Anopheles maculipalpis TaxID=1496333 RepID=UPI002159AF6D|nr:uncharacterized protein LOC126558483 [Anopheles maculipalpis]
MFMDDSGIESGDKLESLFIDELATFGEDHLLKDATTNVPKGGSLDSDAESDIYSKLNDFDVVFENPGERHDPIRAAVAAAAAPVPDSDRLPAAPQQQKLPYPASAGGRKVLTSDNSTDSFASSSATSSGGTVPSGANGDDGSQRDHSTVAQLSTCKILQRKLELKVERAKRNYKQMYQDGHDTVEKEPKISSLIPISRLPIPAGRESHQLVDVNTGFNSDDDELENVSFFPRHNRKGSGGVAHTRQELSDTFSIQEMTIESDNDELDFEQCRKMSDSKGYRKILNRGSSAAGQDDYLDNDTLDEDDDSQNLELLPPKGGYAVKEQLRRMFCCCWKSDEFL